MLSDLDCANLCQAQYDSLGGIFDAVSSIAGVDFAIRSYPDCMAVVFEGSHDLPDWISNFDAVMLDVPDFAGVERGFYSGLPDVFIHVSPLLPKEKPVYVTGHSRGAAHAHIFAAMLIKQGYIVIVTVFGSPRPGDAKLAQILSAFPNRSYRNYAGFDHQDFVCDVPFDIEIAAPYVHPYKQKIIDMPPAPNDPWGLLARHHLFLYTAALQRYPHGQSDPRY